MRDTGPDVQVTRLTLLRTVPAAAAGVCRISYTDVQSYIRTARADCCVRKRKRRQKHRRNQWKRSCLCVCVCVRAARAADAVNQMMLLKQQRAS